MFRILFLLILIAASPAGARDDKRREPCVDADSQLGLNTCAGNDRDAAERDLSTTLDAIRAKHRDDPAFLQKLATAQDAWSRFRDAELKALYPHDDEPGYYGSVFPMCWGLKAAELTRKRTSELRVWLDGVGEGDVCAGSVPFAQPK